MRSRISKFSIWVSEKPIRFAVFTGTAALLGLMVPWGSDPQMVDYIVFPLVTGAGWFMIATLRKGRSR